MDGVVLIPGDNPRENRDVGAGAPEARQIFSLGREPQDRGYQTMNEPRLVPAKPTGRIRKG
jgi:hypothetical protein